jgi:hypothetical protein
MKRAMWLAAITALLALITWAGYLAAPPEKAALAPLMPHGALLYLEAKDFAGMLEDWNRAPEKQLWLKSDNYQVFSRSRLFLRLGEAQKQFATAAGIPPDVTFLSQAAGKESALGLYDIGKLEFLYVSHVPTASAMQSALWESRAKFESRSAAGIPFFVRVDPESHRVVAFAIANDYLLLSTREDLLAKALALLSRATQQKPGEGSVEPSMAEEQWFQDATTASGVSGDLRMVLNLEKLTATPYFRSYWIQRNTAELKRYSAAVSDLFREGERFREERVLLRNPDAGAGKNDQAPPRVVTAEGEAAVGNLLRLVPDTAGLYRAEANPSAEEALEMLESNLLAPHLGPAPAEKLAPQANLTSGETGSASDLETRIDVAPTVRVFAESGVAPLKKALEKTGIKAVLQVESSQRRAGTPFVTFGSAFVLVGSSAWDGDALRAVLQGAVGPGLTTYNLGTTWRPRGDGIFELDGLMPLAMVSQGDILIVSSDSETASAILARISRKPAADPAIFAAGFHHAGQRENLAHLTLVIDRPKPESAKDGSAPTGTEEPAFFSGNIASLSRTLAAVKSETIVVREKEGKVFATITYEWSR